jgi:hypothetical protein
MEVKFDKVSFLTQRRKDAEGAEKKNRAESTEKTRNFTTERSMGRQCPLTRSAESLILNAEAPRRRGGTEILNLALRKLTVKKSGLWDLAW